MRWQTLSHPSGDIEENPDPYASFSEGRLKYLRLVAEGGNWKKMQSMYSASLWEDFPEPCDKSGLPIPY